MGRLFSLLLALLGAAALSQAPEFGQQYVQRVGGAVDALRDFVTDFNSDTEAVGISREEALQAYAESGEFLSLQGATVESTLTRFDILEAHLAALRGANAYERTWLIAEQHDLPLLRATADAYVPALPLTLAGAAHAGIGFVLGWVIGAVISGLLGLIFGPMLTRRPKHAYS